MTIRFTHLELTIITCAILAMLGTATSMRTQLSTKVIGGAEVTPHSIPSIVSVRTNSGFHVCGGFIYDEYNIITTAS